jgi:hypothetical protein
MRAMRASTRLLVVLAATLGVAAAFAALSAGQGAVVMCGMHRGFVVYANGVSCPTAKKIVRRIDEMRYRAPKVTIRSIPGYLCVATYKKTAKTMKAGSCLKIGTQATGFGWTKDGAQVPLPPGADSGGVTG